MEKLAGHCSNFDRSKATHALMLRCGGRIFKPAKAARFLHNIILLEARGEGRNTLKVRVAEQHAPGGDGVPFVLGYVRPLKDLTTTPRPLQQDFSIDAAIEFCFIDVGAGLPHWPAKTA